MEIPSNTLKSAHRARHAQVAEAFGLSSGWHLPRTSEGPPPPSASDRALALACAQAVRLERQRIRDDLHDGCGGLLVTALRMIEHEAPAEQVAAALRECIDDLRLTLDSLLPAGTDLVPMLAALRDRSEVRLAHLGIRLEWSLADLPPIRLRNPHQALQLLRILQEALANVIRHAHARKVRVELALRSGALAELEIRIHDDGVGLRGEHQGQGVLSMQRRATQLGGQLLILSDDVGTLIEVRLPLPEH